MTLPERIAGVRLGRLLTSTGDLATYAGVDPGRDAPVSVTVMTSSDQAALARFVDAARTLVLVRSERVLRVFDAGSIEGVGAYAITELAGRETLADRIAARAGEPFPFADAFAIATQAAECLLSAHGHGLVFDRVSARSFLYVAGADGRERLVVAAWSLVPVAERVTIDPSRERDAIVDWAAGMVSTLSGGEPVSPDPPMHRPAEAGLLIMQRIAAPPPGRDDDTIVMLSPEPAVPPGRRRPPAAAVAAVLIAGLVAGALIGWAATRSQPVSSPGASAGSGIPVATPLPSGTPAASRPASVPASVPASAPASPRKTATTLPSVIASPAASASADDPQGRSGRYTGFITATTDDCGALQKGRNYGITVDVIVTNRGTRADFTIRLSYRDQPVAITVTLAENGAFRGDYNIDGTAGSMTGRFAGQRITDARGKEEACEYAWSATRSG